MENLYEILKEHLIDSTAIWVVANPALGIFEIGPAGMSNETSLHARILGSALLYAGLGSMYSRGRDFSKRIFKITEETRERVKTFHDAAFTALYTGLLQPPFYYVAGSRSIKEIAIGTVGAAGLTLLLGPAMGYTVDAYRDLTGIKESERLPYFIKNQTPTTKRYMAGLLTAASVGALATIYSLNK